MDPRAESLSLCRFYHSFFRGRGPLQRGERQRACADGMPMPVKHSERGCPTRTQPLPQLPGWPCKTNSNATPRRRAQLPCTELFEYQHHRVLWPIVDVAPGDCSFLLGCWDSSLRLRLLRCIMPLQLSRHEQHTSRLAGLEVDASGRAKVGASSSHGARPCGSSARRFASCSFHR